MEVTMKFRHEYGKIMWRDTDARGLRLLYECGYRWVDRGKGWEPLASLVDWGV